MRLFRRALWLAGGLALASPAAVRAELAVGSVAPDIREALCDSRGLTGEEFRLSDGCAGKIVYLEFNNPTCPRCHAMIRTVQNEVLPSFLENPKVVFVQVAYAYRPYGVADVVSMIAATGCTQKVLAEDDGDSYAAYDITGIPYSYIIDGNGVIRYARGGSGIPAGEIAGTIDALLGGSPPPTPAPVITPFPTPEPTPRLVLECNAPRYRPGDQVRIAAELSGVARPFDAYAVIRQPDGSSLSITAWGGLRPGMVPLAAGVPSHIQGASYELLNDRIPPGIAAGTYRITASLMIPGTLSAFWRAEISATVE